MSEREHQFSDEGISPLGNIRVVSIQDPALDFAAMEGEPMRMYIRTRDPKHLRFLPGRETEATWYTLRPLTQAAKSYVEDMPTEWQRWMAAVSCSLKRVENRVNHETGETIPGSWEPENTRDVTSSLGCKVVRDEDIHTVVAMHDHIEEMGHLVYRRGKLHPKERRAFGLPRGSDLRGSERFLAAVDAAKAKRLESSSSG